MAFLAVDYDKEFPRFLAFVSLVYAGSVSRRLDAPPELLRRVGRMPDPGP